MKKISFLTKKKIARRHSVVIQEHHISYEPEIKVKLWKGEHWIAHQMLRRKRISKGFIVFLKDWLEKYEKTAEELK